MKSKNRQRGASPPQELLTQFAITSVLCDVGASAGPPAVWNPIAADSLYLGFDPDARDLPPDGGGRFKQALIVNRAITVTSQEPVTFYLTRSAQCSSTLKPDHQALADYSFAPLFDVVDTASVPAATLNEVLETHRIAQIDWLKVDTQGTDLRIFSSLHRSLQQKLLAIDVEPGLIAAYEGEDLFVDVHRELVQQGFWLSNLNIGCAVRMNPTTPGALERFDPSLTRSMIDRRARPSPAWCEARYLKTARALRDSGLGLREHVLLAVFAALDAQWAFAFETLMECEAVFGPDPRFESFKEECARRLADAEPTRLLSVAQRVLPRRVKTGLKRVLRLEQFHRWLYREDF